MTTNNKFIGEKLRLGRQLAGLTLEELGELVGASRQYIHQLETGTKSTTNQDTLEALADALKVYPAFFMCALENDVKEDQCHFRRQKTTLVSTIHQAIAHGTLFDSLVTYLGSRLSLPLVDFPQVDIDDDNDIEAAAIHCRQHWKLTVDQPIRNMIRVVENAGAFVTMFEGISSSVDAFSIDRGRPVIVRSTAKESPTRLRFDVAHECGHIVMHKGINTGDEKTEMQANRFASAFLLPKDAFVKQFPKSRRLDWMALFGMKRFWSVSVQAIVRRAFDLKLIDYSQYKTANIFISKSGYKRNEPYEPQESEVPELIPLSLGFLSKHLGINPSAVAAHLNLKSATLAKLVGMPISEIPTLAGKNVVDFNRFRRPG